MSQGPAVDPCAVEVHLLQGLVAPVQQQCRRRLGNCTTKTLINSRLDVSALKSKKINAILLIFPISEHGFRSTTEKSIKYV